MVVKHNVAANDFTSVVSPAKRILQSTVAENVFSTAAPYRVREFQPKYLDGA